jgi:hypothetical protein
MIRLGKCLNNNKIKGCRVWDTVSRNVCNTVWMIINGNLIIPVRDIVWYDVFEEILFYMVQNHFNVFSPD